MATSIGMQMRIARKQWRQVGKKMRMMKKKNWMKKNLVIERGPVKQLRTIGKKMKMKWVRSVVTRRRVGGYLEGSAGAAMRE